MSDGTPGDGFENGCARVQAEAPCYVQLPVIPTIDLLELIAVQRWPEDWDEGRKIQIELGCDVVPPNAEMEMAAGIYKKLIDALK